MALDDVCAVNLAHGRMRPNGAGGVAPCAECSDAAIMQEFAAHCPTCSRPTRYVYSFSLGRGGEPYQRALCAVCDPLAA